MPPCIADESFVEESSPSFTVTFCPATVAVTPSASLTGSLPIRDGLPHLASAALSFAPRAKIAKPFLFAVTPHRLIAAEVPFEIGLLKS